MSGERKYHGPWRKPDECTEDYPGLTVHDGRVFGSINFGESRLSAWAIIGELIHGKGWDGVEHGWGPSQYGWDADRFAGFLADLLACRGEFGRLLCVLADMERSERVTRKTFPELWWTKKRKRNRVRKALLACLDALDQAEVPQ